MRPWLFPFLMAALLSQAVAQAPPQGSVCNEEPYRQFDFWLGEWEVFNPKGDLAGYSTIAPVQDSCAILENWKSARAPYTGTSHNFYDKHTGTWNQVWIDNQGGNLRLSGGWDGHAMVLNGDAAPGPGGNPVLSRITWTPQEGGTVRQVWEMKPVDGDAWNVVFDGLYRKP